MPCRLEIKISDRVTIENKKIIDTALSFFIVQYAVKHHWITPIFVIIKPNEHRFSASINHEQSTSMTFLE